MNSASSSSSLRRTLTSIALIVPPAKFISDTFYSLYRVQGSSMEPALQDGDVLLVRKADVFPHLDWKRWTSSSSSSYEEEERHQTALRVIAQDAQSGRPIGENNVGYTYLHPPTIHQLGVVVVYRAPDAEKYPTSEYRVKRVVGLGGQIVRPRESWHRIERVPSFALWVEGDNNEEDSKKDDEEEASAIKRSTTNHGKSIDSRTYGPVCKNLVEGIAERIIWPPSRWGVVSSFTPSVPRSWWA
ncbi:mitochondrial inner membrane protease subunit 2 [Skeletonema marinoi]|uniref:Mitochondrial inner membrane protease subunit n=1 Tax=Skeletonema marinoi TaxID=267567 RepID=A0AAD9D710_9STRA|nr:mitochondrial inner membrane protease subunit 2 [Skeletonema marinoi]